MPTKAWLMGPLASANAPMRCSRSVAQQDSIDSRNTAQRIAMFRGSHRNIGWRVPVLLFLGVYFFSGLSPVGTSFDSRWTVYIAMSLWDHHDTNLDEYSRAIRENDFYAVECVDAAGHVRIGPPE